MTSSSVAASPFMYTEVCPPEPSSQFEFTENGYGKILDFAVEHYTFVPFGSHAQSPSLLWRHDVDMSVHRALALSQLEFDRGLAASYFIRSTTTLSSGPSGGRFRKFLHAGTRSGSILKLIRDLASAMRTFSKRNSRRSAPSSKGSPKSR